MSGPRRSTALLSIALLSACALAVALGTRVIGINKAYAELKHRASEPHQGYAVPAFVARTLGGDTLTVGESGDPSVRQVLFVLTTTCPYCKATLPVWAALADSLQRGFRHVRVMALSLDSLGKTAAYAAEHRIRYPVATFPTDKLRRLYRAGSVPQTVVLNAMGEVLYAHVGKLTAGPALDSIYQAVARRIPAVSAAAGALPAARGAVAGRRP
ncbi:MAG: TlpA disulfide reductase family protein [Gemmatimonadota bacterium]